MAYDGTLKFDTSIDNSGFKKGLNKLGGIAKAGLKTVSIAVGAAGSAISAMGGYAIKAGSDFESSMSQVAATMGITVEEIRDGSKEYEIMAKAAKDAGATTQFSATQSAQALNYLALAGYDAVQAAEVLPSVLNLAAAGNMDLAYASDLATDAMSALGIEASNKNLTAFGDKMARTASKANTSVSQLGEAILTVGGTAKSLAGGTTELNAVLGVLANRGTKGAEAGTALRNIILSLSAPTDKAAKALKELGVEVFDAEGNIRPLNEIFKDFNSVLDDMTEGQKTQVLNEIFNKVDLKDVQSLLAGCGDEFDNLTRSIDDSGGAMQNMADTQIDNLQGDITILKSALEGLGIQFFESIQNPLREIAQTGTEYIGRLSDAFSKNGLSGAVDEAGKILGEITVKIAQAAPSIVEAAVSLITTLVTTISNNSETIVASAIKIGNALISGIVECLPLIIDGGVKMILGLVRGIAEAIPQHLPAVAVALNESLATILSAVPQMLEIAITLVAALANGLISASPIVYEKLPEIISGIQKNFAEHFDDIIACGKLLLGSLAQDKSGIISTICAVVPDIVESLVSALIENKDTVTDGLLSLFTTAVDLLIESLPETTDCIVRLIEMLSETALENAPILLEAAWEIVTAILSGILEKWLEKSGEIWSGLLTDISAAWENVKTWLSEAIPQIVQSVVDWFNELPEKIGYAIGFIIGKLITFKDNAVSWIKENVPMIISSIVTFFKELPGKIWDLLVQATDKLKSSLSDMKDKAKEGAKKVFDKIVDEFKNLPSKIYETGKNLVSGLWNGINSMTSWLKDRVSNFASGVIKGFKSSWKINSPSKVMEDEVGVYLPSGVEKGIVKGRPHLLQTVKETTMLAVDELSGIGSRIRLAVDADMAAAYNRASAKSDSSSVNNNSYDNRQSFNFYTPTATPSEVARAARFAMEVR